MTRGSSEDHVKIIVMILCGAGKAVVKCILMSEHDCRLLGCMLGIAGTAA
jgi:hypothetical protein